MLGCRNPNALAAEDIEGYTIVCFVEFFSFLFYEAVTEPFY